MRRLLPLTLAALLAGHAAAQPARPAYGPQLEGFDYPYPVQRFDFTSQRQRLSMAFMDVAPTARANGRTAVLLHGKNFCAATWGETIRRLAAAGYRVVAVDQVGFCKSSKPAAYQFSFEQLAANTRALLRSRGISHEILIGHSTGGMLAARWALEWPAEVDQLVLVDPLGLEDWRAKGVPPATVDENYATELKADYASIKAYEQKYYYGGEWRPAYDRWVAMLAGLYGGPGHELFAWDQALTSDMIYTQPVVHEFARLRVPTLLMIGDKDRTAPGATRAPPALQARLGDYPRLARAAARAIPHCTLVEFPDAGHAPQIQDPDRFHAELLKRLGR